MDDIKDFMEYFNNLVGDTEKVQPQIISTPAPIDTVITETVVPQTEPIIEKNQYIEQIVHKPTVIEAVDNNFYKIYKDKSENFNCEISVEGATIDSTSVRLLFETEEWNIFIDGEIDQYGNVNIPIKKMSIFKEGTKGRVKMEVIADNTVFVPWEDDFEVKMSKKVSVSFNENKQIADSRSVNVKMK